jgi:hypothetical protein
MNLTNNCLKKLLLGAATVSLALVPSYGADAANIVLSGFNPRRSLLPGLLAENSHNVDITTYRSSYPTDFTGIDALIIQAGPWATPEAANSFLFNLASALNASVSGSLTPSFLGLSNIIIPGMEDLGSNVMVLGTLLTGGLSPASGEENGVSIMIYTGGDDCRHANTCLPAAEVISQELTPAEDPVSIPEPASVLGLLAFGTAGLLVSRKIK